MTGQGRPNGRLRRTCLLLSVVVVCGALQGGCQWKQAIDDQIAYCEPLDETCADTRARIAAHRVWWQKRHELCRTDDPHRHDIKGGFIDGFYNVATGGNGCVPAVPPRRYWKSCYETPEGLCRINAYFQGYPIGAQMAFQLGYSRSQRVPTSIPAQGTPSCPHCPTPEIVEPTPPSLEPIQIDPTLPPLPPQVRLQDLLREKGRAASSSEDDGSDKFLAPVPGIPAVATEPLPSAKG